MRDVWNPGGPHCASGLFQPVAVARLSLIIRMLTTLRTAGALLLVSSALHALLSADLMDFLLAVLSVSPRCPPLGPRLGCDHTLKARL